MWIWVDAVAKAGATAEAINDKRLQWVSQGRDQALIKQCRRVERYVVKSNVPARVFWLLDTDTRNVVDPLVEHFSNLWEINIFEVDLQGIAQATSSK